MPRVSRYHRYLKTLERVPDRVILAVASREIDLNEPCQCVCGWSVREQLAELSDVPADTVDPHSAPDHGLIYRTVPLQCAELFGGTPGEWWSLFLDIVTPGKMRKVEEAFVERVDLAVSRFTN